MTFRNAVPDFILANPIYAGSVVSYFTADENGEATETLATLYAAPTGSTTVSNPQTLDAYGKFEAPIYVGVPVIAEVAGYNVPSHSTAVVSPRGIWRGTYATATRYYSTDMVVGSDGAIYIAAEDFVSTTLVADVAAGDLVLAFDPAAIGAGIAIKAACRVATTANITLSGTQIIDGVLVAVGDRVLVKDQTTGTANGIYVVASGAWSRSTDFDHASELSSGMVIPVILGTVSARTLWQLSANDTQQKILLHLDGADGSTAITDSGGASAHTWTANGNAQIDTADSKFGGASLLCDGTGDYVTAPDHSDFTLGSGDWTVDCWFKVAASGGSQLLLCGQSNSAATATTISFYIERNASNVIRGLAFVGSSSFICTGTTQFTSSVNTGWHHVALVRTGNLLKLFVDGVQEGSSTAITGTVNDSSNAFSVGRAGEITSATWNGWIDEFSLLVGTARWTTTFTPPTTAYDPLTETIALGTSTISFSLLAASPTTS